MDRVALAEAVARRWNDAGVVYAVAHGVDEWPRRLGRDLDVVVDRRDAARAVALAREVLVAHGLAVAAPPPLWGARLVAAEREAPDDLLEVHTTTRITWRNTALVRRPEPSARVGPFAVDPWVSVAKRVVLPLLAGRAQVFREDPARLALDAAERAAAGRHVAALAGPAPAACLLAALAVSDVDALAALAPRFARAVFRRGAARHPLRAAGLLCHSLARRVREPFTPCAPVVAVVGAPGADAGALVRTIAEGDRLVFTGVVVRPGRAGGVSLGQRLRDRIDSSRQRLVLYDGRPPADGRGVWRRLASPEPDLTIFLGRGAAGPAGAGGAIAVLAPGGDELRRRAVALIIGAFMAKNGGAWRPD